jgi:hypothetical protein
MEAFGELKVFRAERARLECSEFDYRAGKNRYSLNWNIGSSVVARAFASGSSKRGSSRMDKRRESQMR